jgi:outer membrane protein OmpA-like peptidoglycan-associated protein/ABC-type nitrate/sulfonate/bicarbonate transport system substrate-binding protein
MSKHAVVAIIIIIIGIIGIVIFKLVAPMITEQFTYGTSDAKNVKGEVTIALDSWIGYFPFQSPVFKKLMRDNEYKVTIIDDEANYPLRMERLKKGEINFAVCTIDSYLLNGAQEDFPATIIAIIDESKGGDAMVAWKNKIDSIDKLKTTSDYRIAFTPASPSEHLLKAIGVHFGIDGLLDKKGKWRIETIGAEQAYKKLMKKDADIAVIWEPHVTESLSNPDIVKLLGTEDTEKLIIDILLVNRPFSKDNPDVTRLVVEKFYETLMIYGEDSTLLQEDIVRHTKMKADEVNSMLKGVRWVGFQENALWFGVDTGGTTYREELPASIDSTIDILVENNDFDMNPLPNEDPYTIINSSFIEQIYMAGITMDDTAAADYENSLERPFSALSSEQWDKLKVVGSLKLRPITFSSGTADLDEMGEMQLDTIIESIKHYPNFRIIVKGHTDSRGDAKANLTLSQQRADSVKKYMTYYYNISENRIRAIGIGGAEPLPRDKDESSRSYSDRLKRVEIYLVTAS